MLRAYKYRIYPTAEQKVMLAKTFGCCRYVYNWALELKERTWKEESKSLGKNEIKRLLVSKLKHEKADWLNEVSDGAINYAIDNLFDAYDRYFKGLANMPRFHAKETRQSFRDRRKLNRRNIRANFKESTITIPKVKNIPCVFHRKFDGYIKQVHVELTASGKYFASLLVEDGKPEPELHPINPELTLGIDTGVHNYATLSDGTVLNAPPENKKVLRKIKKLQRKLERRQKGSNNYEEIRRKIAGLYEKDKMKRHNHVHKITHDLAYKNQATTFCVESLDIKSMVHEKFISRSIRDSYFQGFYRQLAYKCKWNGKRLIKIGRWEPSSKTCSKCGYVNESVIWGDYEWECPVCKTIHDRDLNAAINIKNIGLG